MGMVVYKKLSKRKQREADLRKRRAWGAITPVTRCIESDKVYNRKRIRQREQNFGGGFFIPVSSAA